MTSRTFQITYFIFIFLISLNSWGLFNANHNNMPSEVNSNWNSIFQFQGAETQRTLALGTATIVGESADRVFLITAKHVINSTCPRLGNCSRRTQITQQNTDLNKTISIPDVKLEGIDTKNDLAMISVSKAFVQAKLPNYKIAKTPEQCSTRARDQIFTVGYPAYHMRYGGNSQLPYRKLWSGGFVKRLRGNTDVVGLGRMTMTEISNEVLPGNSGGPSFNQQGEIVGIVSNGDLDSGHNKKVYSTMIATCESTKKMVASIPGSEPRVNLASTPKAVTNPEQALDLESVDFVSNQ